MKKTFEYAWASAPWVLSLEVWRNIESNLLYFLSAKEYLSPLKVIFRGDGFGKFSD